MIKHIKTVDINYIEYGKGEDIVLLHGWGQNIEMMKPVGDKLDGHIVIFSVAFFSSLVGLPWYLRWSRLCLQMQETRV